ncbi:O-antigen ligase family protein [Chitinophaga sp. 212800010-3]|uniref:O-antigen ligase family protein n=1 Tax=unclassified Chitinophaga TaxID=2619133 RepID=UPI002DF3ABEA|nr:O-antigen ligase domain-containing protein [Chitinophaga sp. 212800010-3]
MNIVLNSNWGFSKDFAKFFVGVLCVLLLGEIGAILLCFLSFIYTFQNTDNGIKGITISFIVFAANPVLFNNPLSSTVSLLRIVLLMIFAVKVFVTNREWVPVFIQSLIVFVLVVWAITLMASYEIFVSLSKLLQFGMAAVSILLAFLNTRHPRVYWISWFYTLFVVVLIISLPFYFVPSVGFATNKIGFQGIFNHPQAFAVFLAPFTALLLGEILINNNRNGVVMCVCLLSVVSLVFTRGRTGLLAIFFALLLILFFVFLFNKKIAGRLISPFKKGSNLILLLMGICILAVNYDKVKEAGYEFLLKREGADLRESFKISRGELIDQQRKNIDENPLWGIGFGLPSVRRGIEIQRDPIFDLPVGAYVEKGFFFLAVIEEVGYVGSLFFFLFLFFLFKRIFSGSDIPLIWMGLTGFGTNIGEATLFSFGGMGLLVWFLIGIMITKEEPGVVYVSHQTKLPEPVLN